MKIRLAIADDHSYLREGIREIMSRTSDIVVQGQAANGVELMALLQNDWFNVVLVDLNMPGLSGPPLIAQLRKKYPMTPVVVLSMHNDGPIIAEAIKAGAVGYVTKGSPPEVLIETIRSVARGKKHVDPAVIDSLVFDQCTSGSDAATGTLSPREHQILAMIVSGKRVGEIADQLCVSPKTVSAHKAHLMMKLGMKSAAELIRYAIKHDIG
ncbi:MAG: DNA-binding response regulator [Rhodocyclaceae bacterium]|nr:MAG: DNA-binding response regulator [Rhodocyclaceae bacterium]